MTSYKYFQVVYNNDVDCDALLGFKYVNSVFKKKLIDAFKKKIL